MESAAAAAPKPASATTFKKERKGFGPGGEARGSSLKGTATGGKSSHAARLAASAAETTGLHEPGPASAGVEDSREREYDEFFAAMDAVSGPALRRGAIPRIIHKVRESDPSRRWCGGCRRRNTSRTK